MAWLKPFLIISLVKVNHIIICLVFEVHYFTYDSVDLHPCVHNTCLLNVSNLFYCEVVSLPGLKAFQCTTYQK